MWNVRVMVIPTVSWATWNDLQRLRKKTGGIGNQKNQDHWDYSIVIINQNTQKNPGDLRRLAVTQTPVKDHQLKLVWKTCKNWYNNSNDKLTKLHLRKHGHSKERKTSRKKLNYITTQNNVIRTNYIKVKTDNTYITE